MIGTHTRWRVPAQLDVGLERLDALAFEATAAPLKETMDYVRDEVAKWAKVVKDTGAKPD